MDDVKISKVSVPLSFKLKPHSYFLDNNKKLIRLLLYYREVCHLALDGQDGSLRAVYDSLESLFGQFVHSNGDFVRNLSTLYSQDDFPLSARATPCSLEQLADRLARLADPADAGKKTSTRAAEAGGEENIKIQVVSLSPSGRHSKRRDLKLVKLDDSARFLDEMVRIKSSQPESAKSVTSASTARPVEERKAAEAKRSTRTCNSQASGSEATRCAVDLNNNHVEWEADGSDQSSERQARSGPGGQSRRPEECKSWAQLSNRPRRACTLKANYQEIFRKEEEKGEESASVRQCQRERPVELVVNCDPFSISPQPTVATTPSKRPPPPHNVKPVVPLKIVGNKVYLPISRYPKPPAPRGPPVQSGPTSATSPTATAALSRKLSAITKCIPISKSSQNVPPQPSPKSLGKVLLINSVPFMIRDGDKLHLPMFADRSQAKLALSKGVAVSSAPSLTVPSKPTTSTAQSPSADSKPSKPVEKEKSGSKTGSKERDIKIEDDSDEDCKESVRREIEENSKSKWASVTPSPEVGPSNSKQPNIFWLKGLSSKTSFPNAAKLVQSEGQSCGVSPVSSPRRAVFSSQQCFRRIGQKYQLGKSRGAVESPPPPGQVVPATSAKTPLLSASSKRASSVEPHLSRPAKRSKTEFLDQLRHSSYGQMVDPLNENIILLRNKANNVLIGYKCNCADCPGFLSPRRDKVLQHIRCRHNCSKPFRCEHCPKSFAIANYLTLHRRNVHSTERPFQCTMTGCWKRFKLKKSLKGHLALHFYEKPFVCEHNGCTDRFIYSYELKQHQYEEHRIGTGDTSQMDPSSQ